MPSFDFRECYHPDLRSIDEVRDVMTPYANSDGHFLVRNSTSKPGMFTVSVMHDKSIKHINIFQRNSFYYFQDIEFSSINKLLQHYKSHDVPNIEGIHRVRLQHPIKKPYTSAVPKPQKKSIKDKFFGRSLDSSDVNSVSRVTSDIPVRRASVPEIRHDTSGKVRPAIPIPVNEQPSSNPSDPSIYYSTVKGVFNHAPDLISQLEQEEGNSDNRCDCGLFFDEAELPRGWTMHISRETGTYGRVFFMGSDQQTSWNLPLEVVCELSPDQQDRLKKLLDEYHAKNMQRLGGAAADGTVQSQAGVTGGASSAQSPSQLASSPASQERFRRLLAYSPGGDRTSFTDSIASLDNESMLSRSSQPTGQFQRRHEPVLQNSYLTQQPRPDFEESSEFYTWHV